MDPQHFRVPSC
jgi:hypothetical protein